MRYDDKIYRSIFPEQTEDTEKVKIESNVEKIETEPIKKESNVTIEQTQVNNGEIVEHGNNDDIGTDNGIN